MFEFDPKEAQEEIKYSCLPKGEYEAEVLEVTSKVSKAGNNMLEVIYQVYGNEDQTRRIYDYIVTPFTLYKLKQLCEYTSLEFDGVLDEQELVGKRLMVAVDIRKETEKYPERNEITRYVSMLQSAPTTKPKSPKQEDVVPF